MKKIKLIPLFLACLMLVSCSNIPGGKVLKNLSDDPIIIHLSDEAITVGSEAISSDKTSAVYLSNDIVYYKDGTDFTYGEGSAADMHTAEEASSHSVINITKPGDYVLSGSLTKGQIAVDLGEEAEDDPSAVVTLVLDGVDISCSVAPGIIFYNVYECGDDDEDTAKADVDTSKAGANILIADNSENTVNGAYVAKIYKSVELSEDGTKVADSKKLHKYDGAIYSKMSMNIYGGAVGNGILNINAENEGLGTELHLTMYGGNININSANDGINSNGWLVIEGGEVNAFACADSMDSGLDSDRGVHLNGGTVVYTGNMLDRFEGEQNSATFMFSEKQKGGVNSYTIKNKNGDEILAFAPQNDFSQLVVSSASLSKGEYSLYCDEALLRTASSSMGGRGGMPARGERPEGGERPNFDGKEKPNFENGGTPPNFNGERPDFKGGEKPDFGGKTPADFPKDKEFPGGKRGEAPPEFDGKMPEGFRPQNNIAIDDSKLSDTFEIKKGSNSFIVK